MIRPRLLRAEISRPGYRPYVVRYDPVTVFHGPNGAGKSTALNAGLWALSGSEPNVAVSAQFDEGFVVHRNTNPGAPQSLMVVHPRGAHTKVRDCERQIGDRLGRSWSWDARAFLGLSDRKRTEELRSYLRLDVPLAVARERVLAAVPGIFEMVAEPLVTTSGQMYVAHLVEALQQAWRETLAEKKATTAAPPVLPADLPAGTVASWRERRDEIDAELGELRRSLGRIEGGSDGRKTVESALVAARHDLGRAARDRAESVQRLNSTRARLPGLVSAALANEENRALLARLTPELEARLAENRLEIGRQKAALRDAEAALAVIEAARDLGMEDLLRRVAEIKDGLYDDLKAQAHRILQALSDVGDVDPTSLRAAVRGLEAQGDAIQQRVSTNKTILASVVDPRVHVRTCEEEIARALTRSEEDEARWVAATGQVQSLEDKLTEAGRGSEATAIQMSIRALEEERQVAERNVDVLNDAVQLQALRQSLSQRAELAETRRSRVRDAGTALRGVETALLDEATAPLLTPASLLTNAVLGVPMGLRMVDGESHVLLGDRPLAAHSESEVLVGMLALQVAVQTQIGGWRVAAVDGLEAMDENRLVPFIRACADLVEARHLDQFFAAHVGPRNRSVADRFPSVYQEASMERE